MTTLQSEFCTSCNLLSSIIIEESDNIRAKVTGLNGVGRVGLRSNN